MKTGLAIILSFVSLAYARAGEPENIPAAIKPPIVGSTPVSIAHAPQLNVNYPAIKLADGRVLSDARVVSFDKKNLTFCIGHRQGIEIAISWGAMPGVWQSAFPLVGVDAQRGAEQVTEAKKAPGTKPFPSSDNYAPPARNQSGGIVVAIDSRLPRPPPAPTPDTRTSLERKIENEMDRRQQMRNTSSMRRVGGG